MIDSTKFAGNPLKKIMSTRPNRRQIFLLSGMPRAGTAWVFEILSAITVASGGVDGRDIRTKYKLEKYLTPGNTVVRLLLPDLLFVLYPWLRGESFAVKTHDSPRSYKYRIVSQWLLKLLIAAKVIIPIYIYRDPRDAVLSAYEFGKRKPDALGGSFFVKRVPNIETGIVWMKNYLDHNWDAWVSRQDMLVIRYEDMIANYDEYVHRIIKYLGLDLSPEVTAEILERFRRGETLQGTHFFKGVAGRFHEGFSPEQLEQANQAFGGYLKKMGYER